MRVPRSKRRPLLHRTDSEHQTRCDAEIFLLAVGKHVS
uniref:Transposase n=1 Tax=Mesocestoides corti TaxID=53468 RepID=A0A5K3FPH2_MESCO